ncbi:MAG: ABC transporter permease [Moraxellaceae bacterium]|nr:ABC transporter permease [Pseudobdellovibrionaceae bacterium]
MRSVWIIFKKEFLGFFSSPLFFLMAFVATVLFSITFSMGIQNFATLLSNGMYQMGANPQQLNIHYAVFLQHLSLVNLLFIFFTPALAMRLLAEEKKNRSFDLLMTSPITSWQIVLSKYLSLITVLFAIEILAFIYIFFAQQMFQFDLLPTILTGTGIFLVGAVYASMSLFASSLTDNPMVAFIIGIVLNLGLWIFGGLADFTDHVAYKKIIEQISVNQHLQLMIDGIFKTSSIVFFISIIFFFCFLCERVIESSRWRST